MGIYFLDFIIYQIIPTMKKTKQKHIIRKVKFLSKNLILTKLCNFLGISKLSTTKKCISQHFNEFFTPIFLVKSKLSTAKKSKTAAFSRVFHPKNPTIFGQKMKISNSVQKE